MESLSKNWITENHIDLEYKKYLLLAYLQHVEQRFDQTQLYPYLSELITHYRNTVDLKNSKQSLFENFKSRVSGMDLKEFKLVYDKLAGDDELMKELESIIDFSIPQFEKYMKEGKKVYEFIESKILFNSVGIVPVNINEGYIFLQNGTQSEMLVYQYNVSLIEMPDNRYRGIHTTYLCSYEKSLLNTFESVKCDLLSFMKSLPNPAAYAFKTQFEIPLEQTFLPLAKRILMKHVSRFTA